MSPVARIRTADGYELHAEAHGEGTPVVLSCGLCNTAENWRPQVEPFVKAGDTIEVEIERIGTLRHPIIDE